jgi:hypothetical protein
MKGKTLISLVVMFSMLLLCSTLFSAETNEKQEKVLIFVADITNTTVTKMVGSDAEIYVGDPEHEWFIYRDFFNDDGYLIQKFTISDELFFSIRRSSSEVQVDIPNQMSATLYHETGEYISMYLGDPDCEHVIYSEFTDENGYFVQEFKSNENIIFSVKRKDF